MSNQSDMYANFKVLWAIPAFKKLIVARVVSNFGNGLAPIALAFGVLGLEGADASDLSIVMAANLTPLVLFMLFGGVLADRYPRALVVGVSDIALSGLVIFNGVMFLTNNATILGLSIVSFMAGTLNALWWPAFSGIVPEVVPEEHLQSANSIVSFGSNMTNIFGIVLGGIIVASIGSGWAIVIDGFTFLIAGLLVLQLRSFGTTREQHEESPSVLQDLVHGWKEFSSRSWVLAVVLGYTVIAMCIEAVFAVVGPYHAKMELGGPKPWSWIMAALSVGMAAGVVISMRYRPQRPLIIGIASQLGMVMWVLAMGLTNWLPILMITAFLCGIGFDFFMVVWQTALQTHIPRESLSRVTSYDAFGSLAMAPIGLVVAGPIAERIGSAETMVLIGIVVAVALVGILSVPGVRNLKRVDSVEELSDSPEIVG